MALTVDTGEYKVTRSDFIMVDPRALLIDWKKNIARAGQEPEVNQGLIDLARDMMPKTGDGLSSGQLNPILVRVLGDRKLEVIGGFRRMKAALWLIESSDSLIRPSGTSCHRPTTILLGGPMRPTKASYESAARN